MGFAQWSPAVRNQRQLLILGELQVQGVRQAASSCFCASGLQQIEGVSARIYGLMQS